MWGAYIPALGVPSGSRVMNENKNVVAAQTRIENSAFSKKIVASKPPVLGADLVPERADEQATRKSAYASGRRNEGILQTGLVAAAITNRRHPSRITQSSIVFSDDVSPAASAAAVLQPTLDESRTLRPPDLLGVGLQDRRCERHPASRPGKAPAPQLGADLIPKGGRSLNVHALLENLEISEPARKFERRYGQN